MRNTSKLYIKSLLSKNGATGGIRTPDPRLRRPLLYPTELQTRKVVGATGFEPTTPWSQARCSTKLSYAPTTQEILCHIFQTLSSIFFFFQNPSLALSCTTLIIITALSQKCKHLCNNFLQFFSNSHNFFPGGQGMVWHSTCSELLHNAYD